MKLEKPSISSLLKRQDRLRCLRISLLSGLFSGFFFAFVDFSFNASDPFIQRFQTAFMIGTLIPAVYLSIRNEFLYSIQIRRIRYLYVVLLATFTLMVCAISINTLVGFFLFRDVVFTWSGLWPAILMSLIISFIYTLLEAIRSFTGKSVILNVLLGRYHRAIQEDIVLMFIDLKASTPTAEKLGPVKFFHFLNEFHEKVEACARYFDGTIYKYLGDGQIIIWPKLKADLALEMILSLDNEFNEIQPQMVRRFQREINYTAGIHSGICLVGEIGTERKEIGYWGDTINTAQRIQDLCKEYQTNLLFSEPFYQLLSNQIKRKNIFNLISEVKLRGKELPISLYSLNKAKSDIPH